MKNKMLSVNPFSGIALKDEGKKSIYLCKYLTKFMYIKSQAGCWELELCTFSL